MAGQHWSKPDRAILSGDIKSKGIAQQIGERKNSDVHGASATFLLLICLHFEWPACGSIFAKLVGRCYSYFGGSDTTFHNFPSCGRPVTPLLF